MKNPLLVLLLIFSVGINAQVDLGLYASATAGYSQPLGDYSSYTKVVTSESRFDFSDFKQDISGGSNINLDIGYQFSALGAGLSFGTYSHGISDLSYDIPVVFTQNGGEISGMYYGLGPDYVLGLGGIQLSFMARGGFSSFNIDTYSATYSSDALGDIPLLTTALKGDSESLPYVSAGMKLGIPLSRKLKFIAKIDYLQTLGDGVAVTDSYFGIADLNQDNVIDDSDLGETTNIDFLIREDRFISPQMINISAGLQYNFGVSAKPRPKQKPNEATKPKPITAGSIVFNNPSEKKEEERMLVALSPKNNARYDNSADIKNFKWELIGKPIDNPAYVVEVTGMQKGGRIYFKKTAKLILQAQEILSDIELAAGTYRWKVKELSTGLYSEDRFFTISTCDFYLEIHNETVECLGYEGVQRKYKVCFDSTYSSTSGDLTFVNTGSGLTVFDQNYTQLSYTLVGSTTNLVTQSGSSNTTVNYCFEVLINSTVTDLGFGLQGDDLDPGPVTCAPGVSAMISNLPSCLCDECEDLTLSLDNTSTTQNGASTNEFNISGDINVNVPIYGIEFQVQSFQATASPSACSEGVTSVEESGMFILPGTSINGNTTLQLVNESISGDPSSNTNASKIVKYISNGPLTGGIPIHLTVGLPGPLSGLDSSCCTMTYEVCIKVKIFYDEGSCKSCVFTQCFNFNNQ